MNDLSVTRHARQCMVLTFILFCGSALSWRCTAGLGFSALRLTFSKFTEEIYKEVLPGSVTISDEKGDLEIVA